MVWTAGETTLSSLSFQEKQRIFGKKFNTHGFEYYNGGFFEFKTNAKSDISVGVVPSTIKTTGETISITENEGYDYEFDWRKVHNADDPNSKYYDDDNTGSGWMTPVKCQSGCWLDGEITCIGETECNSLGGEYRAVGTCWAFAGISALEGIVNLYYNQHLDYNLSEQEIVSCSWSEGAVPGYVSYGLSYQRDNGVVFEECFPYQAADGNCTNDKCSSPTEITTIDGYFGSFSSVDAIKQNLMNFGPLPCKMDDWAHAVACVGWSRIKEGDYIDFTTGETIQAGSDYIGQEYWILKNSVTDWAWPYHPGYIYMINPPDWAYAIETPLENILLDETNILCLDQDGDGYYNWGIGNKPTHCPFCPDVPDGNDNNPSVGPLDEDGAVSANLPYSFGFENGLGDWRQSSNDEIEWTRKSGSTSSSGTGASSAYEGSYYMYVEASSPNYPSKTSILVSPSFNLTTGCNANFKFNYHMYGSAMGSLELQVSTDGGVNWDTELWSISGDQGDSWKSATVSLSGYTGNLVKLRFVATTGSNYTSDIAIDNISVAESLSSTQYITNSQTWSDYRSLCGHLTIQSGGELTITGNTIMPYSANVTVNSGSELIIDGGKLVNSDITINNGGKLTIKNNGKVVINNDEVTINTGGLFDLLYGEIQVFKK